MKNKPGSSNLGAVVSVRGSVVDIQFDSHLPPIYSLLRAKDGKIAIEVLAQLDAHCVRPEFCYRHRWREGDLVMWDNASAMHLAICDYALPQRRLMHRTTVIGSAPI